ncbi:catalase [Salicibibacter cibi]|uniref:Catalase n=1 Tax=Salicibibacter cibi TaxID=2743001 RepID=A0A7T6ZBZ2_9BACI|nr:catalase [Salicibibacter cibi]QQK80701.1 catalase [Salicibibacter cibi]
MDDYKDKSSSRYKKSARRDQKDEQLEQYRKRNTGKGKKMTDDNGVRVSNDRRTLRAGRRGPLTFNDFHFYKKQSHFSRERIPEKVVHARGFGVYGEFETYQSLRHLTSAHFLGEAERKTPVFIRFSNFVGSKGSKDTAVDIRGFAVKFYTEEGNYDSLSLQFPIFILADAMKFMDLTHAAKPSPVTDVPQATTAHDSFWDYVANNQESAHMVMWLMSMRGRPRSWRMMEAWPINTFRFVNEHGKSTFVRFKWEPKLGVHSLLLDEANVIGGVDPDFHRRDIIEAIKMGAYPEYELGIQLIEEEDEFKFDFDILDDTKLWPEEEIPVEIIGKMTLNRLVDNFFAEDEQSVLDPANVVPGIDFTHDPVLQGRAFAYRDTELHRQNSANIEDIPVNRPITERNFNLRDSFQRHRIDVDAVHYHENSLAGNTPAEASPEEGGYVNYPTEVEGHLTRNVPSDSFLDFFSQARLFWNSLSPVEKQDLIETFNFHLGYVESESVRQQNVEMWANVDREMACTIADNIGVERPKGTHVPVTKSSPALSQANTPHYAYTQKVAVLIGDGFSGSEVRNVIELLYEYGVFIEFVSDKLGTATGDDGTKIDIDSTFMTKYSVLFDSFYVVGGHSNNENQFHQNIIDFISQAYEQYKPIGIATAATDYFQQADIRNLPGVVFASNNPNFGYEFVSAIAQQRFWNR